MYLVEGSLAIIWLTILIFISRLFYKSETLHLISNKILLLLLGLISFGIVRRLSMDYLLNVYNINFPIGLIFSTSIFCILPILCYLYVKKTLYNDNTINSSDTIHIVVFIIFYILFELPFKPDVYQLETLSQDDIYWANYFNAKKLPNWLTISRNLLNIIYSFLTYRLLYKTFKVKSSHKAESLLKKIFNKFTHVKSSSKQIEHVRIWLYNFTHLKAILSVVTLFFSIKLITRDEVFYIGQHTTSGVISLLFLILILFLNKNKNILYNLPSFMNEDSLKREKIKTEIKTDEVYKYLINQIEKHELYLNDQFKLDWLANELDIKKEYISVTLIENNFDNFKMFSNYLKIKKAKELIKNGYLKNYNIEALAEASGFKATNTFYRLFKDDTGITPKMFSDNYLD
jgi:AraC-like DNA-binding protein